MTISQLLLNQNNKVEGAGIEPRILESLHITYSYQVTISTNMPIFQQFIQDCTSKSLRKYYLGEKTTSSYCHPFDAQKAE